MLMVLLVVADVIMRRVFNSPLTFSYELIEIALVIVVWSAICYSTASERHISVSVFVSRLPAKTEKFITAVVDFISVVLFGIIGWQSITFALNTWDIHKVTQILRVPYYPVVFLVALGAILAGLMLLVRIINSIVGEAKR